MDVRVNESIKSHSLYKAIKKEELPQEEDDVRNIILIHLITVVLEQLFSTGVPQELKIYFY